MNKEQFYEQERLKGNTDHITSAPDPDYSLPFYQEIFDLMEAYKAHEESTEPYFGWCNVEGCDNEGCCGGACWRETGYWTVCRKHSDMHREGKPQPKMKQKAIDKEKSRDKKTGFLPKKGDNSFAKPTNKQ